jgi:hypothetical protein
MTRTWRKAVPLISNEWWKEHRDLVDRYVCAIPLRRGTPYSVPEAHRRAQALHDPLLAPHGFFRALPSKQNSAAIEFVEEFGPLDWPVIDESPALVLQDFWLKHLRYVTVIKLWESRDHEDQLRSAFSALYENLGQIHFAEGWQQFEDVPPGVSDGCWAGVVPLYPLGSTSSSRKRHLLPWEKDDLTFESWLGSTVFEELHETAINIFHGELNVHLVGREPRWLRMNVDDPAQPLSFQLSFGGGNLWQMIWELTGLDTAQGRSWRICPACNVFFYPKRSDQDYCRSEEQVRASKRNYARTRRQRERLSKLLAPIEDLPSSNQAREERRTPKNIRRK